MSDLVFAYAHELAKAIHSRQITAQEVVDAFLIQITRCNSSLNAIVTLDEEGAQKQAKAADDALARGEDWGPLHGVPITLEDAYPTKGLRSTWGGFPGLANHVPSEDGTVAARLKAAGAIILGKTNGPAVWGTESIFGATHNPWANDRTPGGSSAGPGAALAAGLTALDIGLDTLGSIQSPAHCCGIFGMRPTENRVPLTGAFFIDNDKRKFRVMSVAGPMGRCIEDLQMALQIIAGPDDQDTNIPPVPWRKSGRPDIRKLHIAWIPEIPNVPILPVIHSAIRTLASRLEQEGAKIEMIAPNVDFIEQSQLGRRLFDILAPTLAPRADGLSPAPIDHYIQVLDERDLYITAWEHFLAKWDVFICPAGTITAKRQSDNGWEVVGLDLDEQQEDLLKVPYYLSPVNGCPTVVMPLGRDQDGLPFGVQLMAKRWNDEGLLAIAQVISEVGCEFHRPPGY